MMQFVSLTDAMKPARERHRQTVDDMCAWTNGRSDQPVDRDLITAICEGHGRYSGKSISSWSRTEVRSLMSCEMFNVCTFAGCRYPEGVPQALWRFIDFLAETDRLDADSDPLWELRKPLICYGGLDFNGDERPESSESPIPCECYLPYRETAEYVRRLILNGTLVEDILEWN